MFHLKKQRNVIVVDTITAYPSLTFAFIAGCVIAVVGLMTHDYDHPLFLSFMAGMGASTAAYALATLIKVT